MPLRDERPFKDIPSKKEMSLLLKKMKEGDISAPKKWYKGVIYYRAIKLGRKPWEALDMAELASQFSSVEIRMV